MLEKYVANSQIKSPDTEITKKYCDLQKKLLQSDKERKELILKMQILEKSNKNATEKWIRATAQLKNQERSFNMKNSHSKSFISDANCEIAVQEKSMEKSSDLRTEIVNKELEQLKNVLEIKEKTIRDQSDNLKNLHTEFGKKDQEIYKLVNDLKSLQKLYEKIQCENNNFNEKFAEQKEINNKISKKNEELKKQNEKLSKNLDELKKIYEKELEDSNNYQEENNKLKTQLENYHKELKSERVKSQQLACEVQKMTERSQSIQNISISKNSLNQEEIIQEIQDILLSFEKSETENIQEKLSKITEIINKIFAELIKSEEKYDRIVRKYYAASCSNNSKCHTRTESLSVQNMSANPEKENLGFINPTENKNNMSCIEYSNSSEISSKLNSRRNSENKKCVKIKLKEPLEIKSLPTTYRIPAEKVKMLGNFRAHSAKPSFSNIRSQRNVNYC